jgi:hypothetical protein
VQVARGDIDPFDVSPRDGDGTVSGDGYRFPPEVIHQAIGPGALLSGEARHLVLRQIGRLIGSRTTMPCPEQARPQMGRRVRANFIGSARTYGAHRGAMFWPRASFAACIGSGGWGQLHWPRRVGLLFLVAYLGRRSGRPARDSIVERSGSLIAEQPGNLRERNVPLLDVLESKATSQTINNVVEVCVLARHGNRPCGGIVRVKSILPACASGRGRAPLFLLMNHRRGRADSASKMAYTYLP